MSEHWEFYPCQIEDQTAFISYDHGISEEIDSWDIHQFLWLKTALKTDNGQGLPNESEFEKLCEIDDEIEALMEKHKGAYVGRVTAGGARYYHCYVTLTPENIESFISKANQKYQYQFEYSIETDEQKNRYWEDLFPSEEELTLINDIKVMGQLDQHGDNPEIPRRIDHWIYLRTEQNLLTYKEWTLSQGFSIESFGEIKDKYLGEYGFSLQIYALDKTLIENISETTKALVQKAKELDGVYDGWETGIEEKTEI